MSKFTVKLGCVALSMTGLAGGLAHAQALSPTNPAPFVTAPSVRAVVPNTAPASSVQTSTTASSALNLTSAPPQEMAPWVLTPEQHPWSLHNLMSDSLPALYLSLPSESEARMMLPGLAADTIDHARSAITKYFTDAIGRAAQIRGQQLELINNWTQRSTQQALTLKSTDPWQVYQFNSEMLTELTAYRKVIAEQSNPSLVRIAADATKAIANITPVMDKMPTYELRNAWYVLMTQLKEGVALYQEQVTTGDEQVLRVIDAYISDHPPVKRPNEPLPIKDTARVVQSNIAAPDLSAAAPAQPREPVKPKEEAKSSSGEIIAGIVVLGIIAFFVRLRIRAKKSSKNAISQVP